MLNRLKKNKKSGFTLVELIVVLVILAILAALLIPALTGYINKAKEKQVIAETRQAVMAAQTLADEEYAAGKKDADITTALSADSYKAVKDLAEIPQAATITITISGGTVTELVYTRDNLTCTYTLNAATGVGQYSNPVTP